MSSISASDTSVEQPTSSSSDPVPFTVDAPTADEDGPPSSIMDGIEATNGLSASPARGGNTPEPYPKGSPEGERKLPAPTGGASSTPHAAGNRNLRPVSPQVISPALQEHSAGPLASGERNKVPSPNREKNLTFVPGTGGWCPGFGLAEGREPKPVQPFKPQEFISYPYMPASRFYRPYSAPAPLKAPTTTSTAPGSYSSPSAEDWRQFDTPAEYEAALQRMLTHEIPVRPQPTYIERQFRVNFMPKADPKAFALREIRRQYVTLQEAQEELLRDVVLTPEEVAAYHAIPQYPLTTRSPSPRRTPGAEPVFRSKLARRAGKDLQGGTTATASNGDPALKSHLKALRQPPPPRAVGLQPAPVQPRLDAILADLLGHDAALRGCANAQLPKKPEQPPATVKGSRTLPFPGGFGGRPTSTVGPQPGATLQDRWSPYRNR
eukprot:EG_transcript_11012